MNPLKSSYRCHLHSAISRLPYFVCFVIEHSLSCTSCVPRTRYACSLGGKSARKKINKQTEYTLFIIKSCVVFRALCFTFSSVFVNSPFIILYGMRRHIIAPNRAQYRLSGNYFPAENNLPLNGDFLLFFFFLGLPSASLF